MDKNTFDNNVNKLKKLHLLGIVTGVLAVAGLFFAPNSTLFQEGGTPYAIKSTLMLFCICNIPLLYSFYNKNVVEKQQSNDDRQLNFLKWSYIRMAVWLANVLLCMLVYHFDTDALDSKLCSTFYLAIICLSVYVFLAKINPDDLKGKDK